MDAVLEPFDRLEITGQMRAALDGLMHVESYAWDERGALTLRGQFEVPTQPNYRTIRTRIEALGYTPFLRRSGAYDELLATPGVVRRTQPRIRLPIVLFVITVLTCLTTGVISAFPGNPQTLPDMWRHLVLAYQSPQAVQEGLSFAATLMGILLAHEMGHYVVGRIRHAPVSLPYFIPMPPFISFTGTLGAVIVQREPMEDRRSVLEIGIAGPLAGLIVAIPLLFYGVATSPVAAPTEVMLTNGYVQEGNSILYALVKYAVHGQWLPAANGLDIQINSVASAAWIGLLVTMINLLPAGQLDGGHVAYALLGERANWLAYAILALCFVLGVTDASRLSWLVWGAMILLIGPRHPPPLNDLEPLGTGHKLLAVFGLVVFVLLFMPEPLRAIGGN